MAPVDRLLRADRLSQTVPPAACPHQRTPVAPSWPPRIIAVTSEIRTGQRQELFFEAPLKSLGHFGGDGNVFAIGQLGAVSLDEFLKLLEFSNRRPGSRSESRASRRALNFFPHPIRQMPGSHCCIQSIVYDVLTNYRTC